MQVETFQEFASDVVPKLCAMGPHLACDTVLIGKLIRLAKTFVSQVSIIFKISKSILINNVPNNTKPQPFIFRQQEAPEVQFKLRSLAIASALADIAKNVYSTHFCIANANVITERSV